MYRYTVSIKILLGINDLLGCNWCGLPLCRSQLFRLVSAAVLYNLLTRRNWLKLYDEVSRKTAWNISSIVMTKFILRTVNWALERNSELDESCIALSALVIFGALIFVKINILLSLASYVSLAVHWKESLHPLYFKNY